MQVDDFFSSLAKGNAALLILDYDGTLAPFVQNPQEAYPYPGIMEKVQLIMHDTGVKVVILSGRGLDSLIPLLPLNPLPELWGSHGGERLKQFEKRASIKSLNSDVLAALSHAVKEAHRLAPTLLCEIKPLSVALHWRGKDPAEAAYLLEQWNKMTVKYPLELHAFDGGVELRSREINKGIAIQKILAELPPTTTLIAYLGDDWTDEEAFEILGDRALKVLVRKEIRNTKADTRIIPPDELFSFFDRWIDAKHKGCK